MIPSSITHLKRRLLMVISDAPYKRLAPQLEAGYTVDHALNALSAFKHLGDNMYVVSGRTFLPSGSLSCRVYREVSHD